MDAGRGQCSCTFDGVQVFTATMARTRAELSDKITSWIAAHPQYEIVDTVVTQSSDDAFHCLTYTVFFVNVD